MRLDGESVATNLGYKVSGGATGGRLEHQER